MKKLLFPVCLLTSIFVHAQSFPKAFIGHWKGELLWYSVGKTTPQKVPMQMIIQPADTAGQFTWQIIYGDKVADSRPYIIKPVDTAKGHWVIDERNGIMIDQYWLGNKFTNAFTVGGSTIINSCWIEEGQLITEFYTITARPTGTTGGTGEAVPRVDSYGIKSYQKGILKNSNTTIK